MTAGMEIINVPGATGDYHTNFQAKADAAVREMATHDFGFVHIKAVDDAGHDRNVPLKVEFLEKIDVMLGDLVQRLYEREQKESETVWEIFQGDDNAAKYLLVYDHCRKRSLNPCPVR